MSSNHRLDKTKSETVTEAFPDLNSPTPETLLSLPVDATVAMNQIVSTITQAYHNRSEPILV